jgi:hypothetical protein
MIIIVGPLSVFFLSDHFLPNSPISSVKLVVVSRFFIRFSRSQFSQQPNQLTTTNQLQMLRFTFARGGCAAQLITSAALAAPHVAASWRWRSTRTPRLPGWPACGVIRAASDMLQSLASVGIVLDEGARLRAAKHLEVAGRLQPPLSLLFLSLCNRCEENNYRELYERCSKLSTPIYDATKRGPGEIAALLGTSGRITRLIDMTEDPDIDDAAKKRLDAVALPILLLVAGSAQLELVDFVRHCQLSSGEFAADPAQRRVSMTVINADPAPPRARARSCSTRAC